MKASVIIPTYNRADKIGNLLDSLLNQTVNDFEVIVVVDGSTDNTVEVVEPYKNRFTQFKLMVNQNQGRSKTRNAGANVASGDLLIFYDDDMVPASDSVKKHYEFHTQNNIGALLGGNLVEYVEPQKTDIQNYKASLTKKWTKKYVQNISPLNINNLFFTAANCSIPRNVFEQLNGFDERLTDAEDFDLAYRAIENSSPVFFDKTNVAIHNDSITCVGYIKRIRQYQQAQQKLKELYPNKKKYREKTSMVKHCVYRLFAFGFLSRLIDQSRVLMIFPEKIRYRLYSVIIHSLGVEYPQVSV